jgi:hypothetical protein
MGFDCGPISLDLPPDWLDTTEQDQPLTVSKPNGVGALQFSVATYSRGSAPSVDVEALVSMLNGFATQHSAGPLSNQVRDQFELLLVAASFPMDDHTMGRAWYVSDGSSVAMATYVCSGASFGAELVEADRIVRSLRFLS